MTVPYAMIEANAIVSIIMWDGVSPFTPPAGATLTALSSLPAGVGVGWTLVGSTWTAPAAPPLQFPAVALWQLQAVLTSAQWTALVNAAKALNNPMVTAFIASGNGVIPANSATLAALASGLGITSAQLSAYLCAASAVAIS